MEKETTQPDAGLRSLDHYKTRLPTWRYYPRQKLLPLVRWETPYLAWLQEKMRSPALDSYFALSANLGTHTFFMIFLPILFWCGHTGLGRGLVHILAAGVFFSGFVKDLLCLPRPLSPPLQRITMSGSAALEYGFPSTHSTNAVSVAVYVVFILKYAESSDSNNTNIILQAISYAYAVSIVIGRLYCGMHGFFDVIIGSALGAALALIQCLYGEAFDQYIHQGSIWQVGFVVLAILVLIRVHPEPADDCPCFDDSVSFAGVIIGVEIGFWHYGNSRNAWSDPSPATVPFEFAKLGWLRTVLRIVLGVMVIFAWREVMKPTLLRGLPPLYRIIERFGLSLPRRFFLRSTQYQKVPPHQKDDTLLPSVSDIPALMNSLRHPRRRAISIGPQSEADAYETLAYREKRRRDSRSSVNLSPMSPTAHVPVDGPNGYFDGKSTAIEASHQSEGQVKLSKLEVYEGMMGTGLDHVSATSPVVVVDGPDTPKSPTDAAITQLEEREMFLKLQKPRVRYDVEVVTKLIVYSGIAWIAVEGNPYIFEAIGLSV